MKIKMVCLLMGFSLTSLAQNTPDEQKKTEAKASSESSSAQPDQRKKVKQAKPKNKAKIFVPSEEISEDLPVSFPVDI